MLFYCTYCHVNLTTKQNYNVHLLTKKHFKNKELYGEKYIQDKVLEQNKKKINNKLENSTTYAPHMNNLYITNFKCEYCDQFYKSQRAKSRHAKTCIKKKLLESQKEIELLKKELNNIKNENEYLRNNYKIVENDNKDL